MGTVATGGTEFEGGVDNLSLAVEYMETGRFPGRFPGNLVVGTSLWTD